MADQFFVRILDRLDEAQARWYVAREAIAIGRGGVKAMQQLTGMSRPTIIRGIRELRVGNLPPEGRVRRPGAGRKRLEQMDPGLTQALQRIMEETTAGDPMSLLRWTHKSTETIADELTRLGHPVSSDSVGRRLRSLGYSLQANLKDDEGPSPDERDEQFRYINRQVRRFLRRGDPIISVDTKKKERVGRFKNPGKTWLPAGQAKKVLVHDFPDLGEGTAIPFGTYDPERNEGFVNVGISHDTAEFAVESIRRWWRVVGRRHYADARELLICADCGGSNGNRLRAWKYHLQRLVDDFAIRVTVCHYPPGTSKWNKIEHRMFSFISMNWRGQPLVSYEAVVNLIAGTRTRTGLRIKAKLDTREYVTGEEITDEQMEAIRLQPHKTHPRWNYTIACHSRAEAKHREM
jgi:hypothetical protein